jgi:two-component system response regulator RstA
MAKLLLVEDDARLAALVAEYLRNNGHEVDVEPRGDVAITRILEERPDLVVLDVMLPGEDGLTVCRTVRPSFPNPILMLTARGEEIDQVLGLELGADDYVAKPVSPRLLLARIKALLRRGAPSDGDRVVLGTLVVDRAARSAAIRGAEVELTSAEFDLLWALAQRAGEPISREDLLKDLRGIAWDGVDRSMDVRVSQLRRKLSAFDDGVDRIKTVRGVGYQLVPA